MNINKMLVIACLWVIQAGATEDKSTLSLESGGVIRLEPCTLKFVKDNKIVSASGYEYNLILFLVSDSKDAISVATGSFGVTSNVVDKSAIVMLRNSNQKTSSGIQIIPPSESLKIVQLHHQNAALLSIRVKLPADLEKAKVVYQIDDIWDGRFGIWCGKVHSEEFSITKD